jgi:hypothetical protein
VIRETEDMDGGPLVTGNEITTQTHDTIGIGC